MTLSRDSTTVSRASRLMLGLRKRTLLAYASVVALSRYIPYLADRPRRLWFGARHTDHDRNSAVERGLGFIADAASDPKHFTEWGQDLMWCFYTITNTAKNTRLREMACNVGQERARQWRRQFVEPPTNNVDALSRFVFGTDIADKLLGNSDDAMRRRIQTAVQRFSALDFLAFDPLHEPPPADLPEECPVCENRSPRSVTACSKCNTPLEFRSPYDIWLDALVTTYSGDAYGVQLGASYPEVLRWIS